ncbi:hypothetical protein COV13_02310 [Candidatus Woesearchaeota archaeon CG10_big_fil_rev_8_21_14_0_10_32_9]|nr:MAG: hypothetical protein COV13_02310 [Candidatus Woesearchaeota archaeon CG10_big_fil_rev_8_21_14_0_10_32_9]
MNNLKVEFLEEFANLNTSYGLGISNPINIETKDSFLKKLFESSPKISFSKNKSDIKKEENTVIIKIPQNVIEDVHIQTKTTKNSFFHFNIIVGKNSKCIIHHELSGKGSLIMSAVDLVCEENSEAEFVESVLLDKKSVYYSKKISSAGFNSKILWVEADFSAKKIYSNITSNLDSENSSSKIVNLFFADNLIIDSNLKSIHNTINTTSDILSKGILRNAESFVRGLVKINKFAKNSNGYQKSDVLLLDDSKAVSIPDLEIHNNDVKCSHGSSITRLDEAKVFYMQSRGLSKEQAQLELIEGFFNPVLQVLSVDRVKSFLQKQIETTAKVKL